MHAFYRAGRAVGATLKDFMEKITSLDVRWYGAARVPYTPLGTSCLPRPGRRNDTLHIAANITGVVLQDSTVVRINTDDYHLLCTSGWIARWTARKVTGNNIYPSINHGDKIRPIARIILGALRDEKVRYCDGNRLNLTRGNLRLHAKGGMEIDSTHRSCPMASIVSGAESRRAAARVSARVGNASPAERVNAAALAVREAAPAILAARTAALFKAPVGVSLPNASFSGLAVSPLPSAKADFQERAA